MITAQEMNFKDWNRKDLKGTYKATIKVDGVRVTNKAGVPTSRADKPLYNIPTSLIQEGCWYEVFAGNFKETISIVRASKSERRPIRKDELFQISPTYDPRMELGFFTNPTVAQIEELFAEVRKGGHEGLVLQLFFNGTPTPNYVKVKPVYTADLIITGYVEGKGRLTGKLGKFTTDSGDVGTGFTDAERAELWKERDSLVGTYVEVEYAWKGSQGRLCQTRYVRMRPDK